MNFRESVIFESIASVRSSIFSNSTPEEFSTETKCSKFGVRYIFTVGNCSSLGGTTLTFSMILSNSGFTIELMSFSIAIY